MAPIRKKTARTALRTRAERSARDPRGIYAPPTTSTTAAGEEPESAGFHSLHHQPPPANPLKRKADDSSFGFDGDDFRLSKKDKRTVKHNQLLAKVRDAGVQKKKTLKRRRPAKKLKADLGGLEDALPDVENEDEDEGDGWEGISGEEEDGEGDGMQIEGLRTAKRRNRKGVDGAGSKKMALKSLKHRPGAMKRKRQMEQGEMERFARNLAQMVGSAGSGAAVGDVPKADAGQQDRWAALRRFIGGTMEKDKAFAAA